MVRRIADGSGGRIAVLGAASPAGAHVKAALADRGVPGARVDLYGHQREVAVLSEYDGEARLVQPAKEIDPAACAAVFVCDDGHDGQRLAAAAASGTLVIDLAGSVPGSLLAGSPQATAGQRIVAVPHAITVLLAGLLAPLHRTTGVKGASMFVLRPASDFGEPGLEELREQTVRLLRFESVPTEVFGRQLAFNAVPEHLFPSGEGGVAARVVGECRLLLGAPALPISLSLALVPLFFGHAVAAHIDLVEPAYEQALATWRATPGLEFAADADTGATLDAPEGPRCLIARVDAPGPSSLRVWAVGSEAGAASAGRAIAVAAEAGIL